MTGYALARQAYFTKKFLNKRAVMSLDCVFCKIISKQIPSQPLLETDDLIVIKDIAPQAPIHYLIIPKRHITNVAALQLSDRDLMGDLILVATKLSQMVPASAFRLITNNGAAAGQSVFHLHFHFLADKAN